MAKTKTFIHDSFEIGTIIKQDKEKG